MFRKAAIHLFGLLVTVSLLSGNIFACACCSEPGTYSRYTAKPDKFVIDLVKEFKFAEKSELFMTEAGFDTIEGIDAVRKEDEATTGIIDFSSTGAFSGKAWKLSLKSPKGLVATYSLPVPLRYTEFRADIHDQEGRPNGPLLYKEIYFEGVVTSATGFAKAGAVRGTRYSLVFQGRGSGCNEVEDFTHWRLDIDGPKAGYAFYGKLSSGRKDATATLDTTQ